jgi:hypothetical protein
MIYSLTLTPSNTCWKTTSAWPACLDIHDYRDYALQPPPPPHTLLVVHTQRTFIVVAAAPGVQPFEPCFYEVPGPNGDDGECLLYSAGAKR